MLQILIQAQFILWKSHRLMRDTTCGHLRRLLFSSLPLWQPMSSFFKAASRKPVADLVSPPSCLRLPCCSSHSWTALERKLASLADKISALEAHCSRLPQLDTAEQQGDVVLAARELPSTQLSTSTVHFIYGLWDDRPLPKVFRGKTL